MGSPVHVPGYEVDELIGFGGAGEVWRARDLSTGETVALKRLHVRGPAAVQRLRREAALLAAVAGPHVIGVRAVVVDGDDAVLVLDHAGGGSLATVLGVRGRIEPPELVTVLAPLAAALAASHSRGLVHGDLTPANVLFSSDGRPILADFGVAHAAGLDASVVEGTVGYLAPEVVAGGAVSTASDVFGLGAIGYAALAGSPTGDVPEPLAVLAPAAPAGLREAVESALALDPLDRPDASDLASAVLESCAAGPVILVGGDLTPVVPVTQAVRLANPPEPATEPAEPSHQGHGVPRGAIVAVGVLGVIGLAVGLGVAWGRHGQAGAAPLPVAAASGPSPAVSPSPDPSLHPSPRPRSPWPSIVQRLASSRAEAFDRADPAALAAVYVPGSSAYETDLQTVRSLLGRGLHARGFAIAVEQVRVDRSTPVTVRLHVVDRLGGYTLVDASGAVRGRGPGSPRRSFTMSLRRTGSGWRVAALSPA